MFGAVELSSMCIYMYLQYNYKKGLSEKRMLYKNNYPLTVYSMQEKHVLRKKNFPIVFFIFFFILRKKEQPSHRITCTHP